jgi:hypothetical protein
MISWIITAVLGLFIARIVWIEVRFGRVTKTKLMATNAQIEDIKQNVTRRYREKFGKDPTNQYPLVEAPKVATKRP